SGADGFMAKEDKAKLDGIPPNPRYLAVDWVNPRVIYSSSTQASNSGSTFNVAKTTTLTLTKDLARIRISFDMWCNISNRPMAWRLKVDTNIVATGTVQYSETPVHVSSTISIVPYTDGASHSVTLECAMSGYIDTWYIDDFVLEAPEILPLF
ncbi:MAG: hypothetical protein QME79_14605, partial [Bacillota bacterium]|nr:hypothetical protein [Bacillota bacterium]